MSYRGEQLVKLRNPWGRDVWTGQWSPTSDKYQRAPEELLKILDMKRSGDKDFTHGEFVMAWSDFITAYDNVCLAIIKPRGWTEATVAGRWNAAPRHLWHFRKRAARASAACLFRVFEHRLITSTYYALHLPFHVLLLGSCGEQFALEVRCICNQRCLRCRVFNRQLGDDAFRAGAARC